MVRDTVSCLKLPQAWASSKSPAWTALRSRPAHTFTANPSHEPTRVFVFYNLQLCCPFKLSIKVLPKDASSVVITECAANNIEQHIMYIHQILAWDPSIGYKYRNGPREYISTLILNCIILRIHRSRTTIKRHECFQLVATRHWPFQSNAINFFAIMV